MNIYLAPVSGVPAERISRTMFRKQILPIGEINYKGRTLKFDKKYLTDLAESFHDGAYDQVATMLADTENRHTMDPRQFGGEIRDVEVTDKGLYGVFQLSKDAAKAVKDSNGRIGVSARIVEDLERADGKSFKRALQHVLITTDPRITGMDAWSEVQLSGYDGDAQVTDLTQESYEGAGTMAEKKELDVRTASLEDLDQLTEAELDALSDTDLDALLARFPDETTPEEETVTEETNELVGAALSRSDEAIELANEQAVELAAVRQELANTRFEAERRDLVRQGIPPALLDLARPLLSAPTGAVVDLSNGTGGSETLDAADLVRQILKETAGFIELAKERGHSLDLSEEDKESDEVKAMLEAWDKGNF